jgi:hypothetical protein
MQPLEASRTQLPHGEGHFQELSMPTNTQQRVYDLLRRFPRQGLAAAKQLFWTELNYERANEPLSRRNWPERVQETLDSEPLLLAQHRSQFGSFDVIYARLARDTGHWDHEAHEIAQRVRKRSLSFAPFRVFGVIAA